MTKPAYLKTIVCLAASRKHSGRCIAGKVLDGDEVGTWIRPVSKRPSGELSALDCRYQNAVSAALFDIIELPIIGSASHSFQIENHFNDDKFWWKKKGEASWKQIGNLVDKFTGPIWENGSSSYNGRSDRVPEDRAAQAVIDFGSSLTLIDVGDLEIIVQIEGAAFNNPSRHVRGHFTYSGNQYRMMITDPNIEAEFFAKTDGTYRIGRALLCLSLGEPYRGFAYKLIAAVYRP
ncbi:hypothetical protein V6R85_21870 [Agrobacterium sp. CCNWLW32]|uniref:dual OB domain-containing protein n=1 Tax=Agrobacterium TaxID=357 RepID=UPI000EF1876B|nr:hypothetical protein At1D1108_45730 [Agrobacterium tumefaciens]NSY93786.1 hypothetical protein [Agrobacterium tumefaciens]